ncbi:hypothetical protein AA14337_3156 [Acetobacter malorum DSM 14337]|uniref:Uncharacterized protein n=1 Tax=Acetobacter malorum DSM 14337 TaxID=1307910 RepID=A0ABQ0PZY9_9PROT|nr:hypothetical protein [Acetobacter malorum]KXV05733.1 hypothetical protein AD930_11420 [Acetobacter malorum]GBQ85757.1 hypothetical protein AA14337_3156 [Acetobacter malorum DSM 14337]
MMSERECNPIARHKHRQSSAAAKIIDLLVSCPEISAIMPEVCAVEGVSGGGGWSWVIPCEGFDIGSEHRRREFLEANGLALAFPAFGQIECFPSQKPGIEIYDSLQFELSRKAKLREETLKAMKGDKEDV